MRSGLLCWPSRQYQPTFRPMRTITRVRSLGALQYKTNDRENNQRLLTSRRHAGHEAERAKSLTSNHWIHALNHTQQHLSNRRLCRKYGAMHQRNEKASYQLDNEGNANTRSKLAISNLDDTHLVAEKDCIDSPSWQTEGQKHRRSRYWTAKSQQNLQTRQTEQ